LPSAQYGCIFKIGILAIASGLGDSAGVAAATVGSIKDIDLE